MKKTYAELEAENEWLSEQVQSLQLQLNRADEEIRNYLAELDETYHALGILRHKER